MAQDRLPPGGLAGLGTPVQELGHLLHEETTQQHRGLRRVHLTPKTNDNSQNNKQYRTADPYIFLSSPTDPGVQLITDPARSVFYPSSFVPDEKNVVK